MAVPIVVLTSLVVTFLFYIMMFGGGHAQLESEPRKLLESDDGPCCTVPDCDNHAQIHLEEYGWHFCKEHGKWFDDRLKEIEEGFPKAVAFITEYDDWRFQAELQNYPEGCYDNILHLGQHPRARIAGVVLNIGLEVNDVEYVLELFRRSKHPGEFMRRVEGVELFSDLIRIIVTEKGRPFSYEAFKATISLNTKYLKDFMNAYWLEEMACK